MNLRNYPLREWNGLLFEDNGRDIAADLARLGPCPDLDFSGYVFDKAVVHECSYNWKTFIEVYLEDYHVGPFHPGLGNFRHLATTCAGTWPDECSLQTVGLASPGGQALGKSGSDVYKRWQAEVLN